MCKQMDQIKTELARFQETGELPEAWAPIKAIRHLGNFAIEPTRSTGFTCDDCSVSWIGCAAAADCPECGKSFDWHTRSPTRYVDDEEFDRRVDEINREMEALELGSVEPPKFGWLNQIGRRA